MSLAPEQLDALRHFVATALNDTTITIEPASADASFRSYWRARGTRDGRTYIAMNAPSEKEDSRPWLDIGRRLRAAGLNAPEVIAEDLTRGFILMSDLGSEPYLPALNDTSVDALYGDALEALLTMQTRVDTQGLPDYSEHRLITEMELMPTWFLQRHLGVTPECEHWDIIEDTFRKLTNSAREQPQRFVHRDYHSRNLMIVPGANPGIIDFQDAVLGPVTYDLVSLLRDCYIAWPEARVAAWSQAHAARLIEHGIVRHGETRWQRWFDWMGLQRHIKVLGIFCRLWYRDGKAGYLRDLPLVLRYTLDVAARYPELADFAAWLRGKVGDRDLTVPRAGA